MMLLNWITSAIGVMLVAYIVPGIEVKDFITALLVALVLGLVNAIIRPLLIIFTLPITILSLGLWLLVVNALMLLLVDRWVSGFTVNGFWTALLGSVVLTLIGWAANTIFGDKKKTAL